MPGNTRRVMYCGGKRSATPLFWTGVAQATSLFRRATCPAEWG